MTVDILDLLKQRAGLWEKLEWVQGDLAAHDLHAAIREIENLRQRREDVSVAIAAGAFELPPRRRN